jgi:nucleoside 2-deoxyribosyltransferase
MWCCSKSNITIEKFCVNYEDPRAFIVMQFTPPYNELYGDVISKICQEEFKIKAIRSDEIYGPGIIMGDIEKQIIEAKLVIAEITPANPNVYYEVGFARALRKPTILIAEKGTTLPFDVSPFRILFYENSISGKKNIEDALRKHLKAILTEGWRF